MLHIVSGWSITLLIQKGYSLLNELFECHICCDDLHVYCIYLLLYAGVQVCIVQVCAGLSDKIICYFPYLGLGTKCTDAHDLAWPCLTLNHHTISYAALLNVNPCYDQWFIFLQFDGDVDCSSAITSQCWVQNVYVGAFGESVLFCEIIQSEYGDTDRLRWVLPFHTGLSGVTKCQGHSSMGKVKLKVRHVCTELP